MVEHAEGNTAVSLEASEGCAPSTGGTYGQEAHFKTHGTLKSS